MVELLYILVILCNLEMFPEHGNPIRCNHIVDIPRAALDENIFCARIVIFHTPFLRSLHKAYSSQNEISINILDIETSQIDTVPKLSDSFIDLLD